MKNYMKQHMRAFKYLKRNNDFKDWGFIPNLFMYIFVYNRLKVLYNNDEVKQLEQKVITLKSGAKREIMYFKASHSIGNMQILHGMAEHMGRYIQVAEYFNQQGYHVLLHNHEGHGNVDQDEKGHFDSIQSLVDESYEIFTTFEDTNVPNVLLGHSMGSIIARVYLKEYPNAFQAVILSGTGYYDQQMNMGRNALKSLLLINKPKKKIKQINQLMVDTYNRQFKPKRTESDWLALNEATVDAFVNDPLCGFDMSLGALYEISTAMKQTQKTKYIKQYPSHVPMLLVSGANDPFSNNGKGLNKYAMKLKFGNMDSVTIQLYENARHEVMFEANQKDVLQNINRWLGKQI